MSIASAPSRSERSGTQPPGLLEGGPARVVRRARHRAEDGVVHAVDQVRRPYVRRHPDAEGSDRFQQRTIAPGTTVRFRLVNSDSTPHRFVIAGAPVRVVALDVTDLQRALVVYATQRSSSPVAVEWTSSCPTWLTWRTPRWVWRSNADDEAARVDSAGLRSPGVRRARSDSLRRRQPLRPRVRAHDHPEARVPRRRARTAVGDQRQDLPGAGLRRRRSTSSNIRTTRTPSTRCTSRSPRPRVDTRQAPASGSPWWSDMKRRGRRGSRYVAQLGLWMDYCHNLRHAADGLTMQSWRMCLHTIPRGRHPRQEPEAGRERARSGRETPAAFFASATRTA